MNGTTRQYFTMPAGQLQDIYNDTGKLRNYLRLFEGAFSNVGWPSYKWHLKLDQDSFEAPPLERLVVSLDVEKQSYELLRKVVEPLDGQLGSDLPFFAADHWCPGGSNNRLFGDRRAAHNLIHAEYLKQNGLSGDTVNVVVIDRGISKQQIKALGGRYGGGWEYGEEGEPGSLEPGTTPDGHGMMVVRNIFEIAPRVRFFDCPLLPEHIADIPVFLDLAEAAYQRMIVDIKALRKIAEYGGPWIFVNAWAIYDRKTEWPAGDYTNGPDHPFNKLVTSAVRGNIDVLFCAGNCGAFCPSSHCGANDRGPGNSILGANSHPHVITVGAVRTDTIWVGFSSEGPGQSNLDRDKPDLCAPSQFSETGDAHTSNGGTSAACALTAGVVAGLRSRWGASVLPPAFLKLVLKQTAMKQYDNWQAEVRLGSGIMNAEAAYNEISRLVP